MQENKMLYEGIMTELHHDKELRGVIEASQDQIKTCNHKLYKYYSCDSKYILENLRNDIVYCSNPKEFNDPFDCNPGISVDELVKMALFRYYTTYIPGIREKSAVCMAIDRYSAMTVEQKEQCEIIVKSNVDYIQKCTQLVTLLGMEEQFQTTDFETIYLMVDEKQNELKNKLSEHIGISCFTTKYDNLLMWSHYANKHTGICVEYDFSTLFNETNNIGIVLPVDYSDRRKCFPFEKAFKYSKNKVTKDTARKLLPDFIKMLLSKSAEWQYEDEWRMVIFPRGDESRKIFFPYISKIILGSSMKKEHCDEIYNIAMQKNIVVERSNLKRDKFGLEFQKENLPRKVLS